MGLLKLRQLSQTHMLAQGEKSEYALENTFKHNGHDDWYPAGAMNAPRNVS